MDCAGYVCSSKSGHRGYRMGAISSSRTRESSKLIRGASEETPARGEGNRCFCRSFATAARASQYPKTNQDNPMMDG
jgi:hypothetical protein